MTNYLSPNGSGSAVPQIETSTQLLGGPGGPLNQQAQALLNLVGPSVLTIEANFASIPAGAVGLFLVLADETKGGGPTLYLITATHRYWFAMVQDA